MVNGKLLSQNEHTVGVSSSVGHGEEIALVVLLDEVLISKFFTIDRLSTGTL